MTRKALAGSIIEDILELSLGPISGSRLPVRFGGVRRQRNGYEESRDESYPSLRLWPVLLDRDYITKSCP